MTTPTKARDAVDQAFEAYDQAFEAVDQASLQAIRDLMEEQVRKVITGLS